VNYIVDQIINDRVRLHQELAGGYFSPVGNRKREIKKSNIYQIAHRIQFFSRFRGDYAGLWESVVVVVGRHSDLDPAGQAALYSAA
jgi:hypothetical protein